MAEPPAMVESRRGLPQTALDKAALRRRVEDAAYQVFLEEGYVGARISLVAARAGTSNRSIYAVFAENDDLFAGVVMAKRHLILNPIPVDESPEDFLQRLEIFVRLDLKMQADQEREALLDLITREAALSPRLTAYLYDRGIIITRDILIKWLSDERQAGRVAFSDIQIAASLFMNVVFGSLLPRRRMNGPVSSCRRQEQTLECLRIVINGLKSANDQKRIWLLSGTPDDTQPDRFERFLAMITRPQVLCENALISPQYTRDY